MPDTVRYEEEVVVCGGARGGGGCSAQLHPSGNVVPFSVRGSAYGEAVAEATGELRAEWFSTELYGEIPEIGPVIFRYRKDRPSSVVISSKQEGSDPFFPARAVQTLFYEVEVQGPDGSTARLLRNEEPMKLVADIDAIPPNGTQFESEEDAVFVDASDPTTPVFTMLAGSPGEVDDPGGLAIRLLDDTVESTDSGFSGEFEVTATEGAEVGRITTFATAVGGASLVSPNRIVAEEFTERSRFPLNVEIGPGEGRAGVIIHAFAPEGPPAEAHVVHMF